jgi:hypothetical protein
MKKLGKLQINPEKVMKNEELIGLRGGTETYWRCFVNCEGYSENGFTFASTCGDQEPACANNECYMFFEQMFDYCWCNCSQYYY